MEQKKLGIALAGYGMIGRLHAMNYRHIPFIYPGRLPELELRGVCTARESSARAAQAEAGFITATTDIERLLEDPLVQVVDIALPNNLHLPVARAALAAGKHVYCEKPLAGTLEDALAIQAAAEEGPGTFGMVFQYRFIPAVLRARELLQQGALGRIFSFRAEYLHSGYQDPQRPLTWRMKREAGGSGALGDLGSHVIDLMRYLLGDFESLQAHLERFIPRRPLTRGGTDLGEVTVDDAAWLRVRLASGALGTIEASRFATGTLDDLRFWIYGEGGALHFDLMNPNYLAWFDENNPGGDHGGHRGWQMLQTVQHYPGALTPPARSPLGWDRAHTENQVAFLAAVTSGREPSPGIADGLAVQAILDGAERSAAAGGVTVVLDHSLSGHEAPSGRLP
ncbi:Gfo/Idh/MocA family protein [Alkalispirochaeta alkalica]|uniref:Gfo/Idh/MocA family protein n=1 Tax=Alkalispirochaeta alkalica TaxID=46356 RepID=UPI00035E7048|nr:Gfo/Idh/MocA family oxidoreductase [Alkalispirochaeta alkalica]